MTDDRPIIFCGRHEAEEICRRVAVPRVLSLTNPDSLLPRVQGTKGALFLQFFDTEEPSRFYPGPTRDHVEQIVGFMAAARRHATLVHCEAGISRSAAATMIGYYLLTGDEKQAARRTRDSRDGPMRDHVRPNRLILFYADELLRSKLADAADYV